MAVERDAYRKFSVKGCMHGPSHRDGQSNTEMTRGQACNLGTHRQGRGQRPRAGVKGMVREARPCQVRLM